MGPEKVTNILSLDGGGSKGLYTLGVLKEFEIAAGKPLYETFDLIYGTSTGSIIAAMIALGYSVDDVKEKYLAIVPPVMKCFGSGRKSKKLSTLGKQIFGDRKFDEFKTGIGIIATNYITQRPLIFKNDVARAHGTKSSFVPGFGVGILDAVEASCAACPVFSKKVLHTQNKEKLVAIDGGFIANNPTLFALIDAKKALKLNDNQIRILSVGVGNYIEKPLNKLHKVINWFEMGQIASRILVSSSNTTEVVTKLLFPEISITRINDTFNEPQYGTNMIEYDLQKLKTMYRLGLESYAKHEPEIIKAFFESTSVEVEDLTL
ncbi:MAG TPA: patatin-like phospholipase family protein [Pedobacter sp.]|jgi:predicted patatin/cPLA2 family phospholipase